MGTTTNSGTNAGPPEWAGAEPVHGRRRGGGDAGLSRLGLFLVLGAIVAAALVVLPGGIKLGDKLAEDAQAGKAATAVSAPEAPAPSAAQPVVPPGVPLAPPPAPEAQALADEFAKNWPGASLLVQAVGAQSNSIQSGDPNVGPAWSTIKVPLVIAAMRKANSTEVTPDMRAAITQSDNAAADRVWATLGTPQEASAAVEKVLSDTGFAAEVPATRPRPEFSAFGQTMWTLNAQLGFLSAARCDPANAPAFDLMGEISGGQRWGLGQLPGAQFKGGWGPDPGGAYLVRQMGVVNDGRTVVAVAVKPGSGSFDDGTATLNQIGTWLQAHLTELPVGQC